MSNNTEKKGLNISAKSFVTAIAVIFVLMALTYGLTFIVPGGEIPFWKCIPACNWRCFQLFRKMWPYEIHVR